MVKGHAHVVGSLLALVGTLACAPAKSAAPMEPITLEIPAYQPVEAAGLLAYVLVPDPLELHARPDAASPALLITGGARAVEVLHEREGWWEVRTFSPAQARALELDAKAAVEMFELHGWIPARPQHGITLHPISPGAEAALADTITYNVTDIEPPPAEQLPFVIPAGTTLYWPDGSEAGRVRETHGFHRAAHSEDTTKGLLLCHDTRSSPSLGVVSGALCSELERVRDAERLAAQPHGPIPALDSALPATAPPATAIKGALDRDVIRTVVRENIGDIRACYNASLAKDPQLEGRVTVNFVIAGDGHVSSALLQESDLDAPALETCIVTAAARWMFPAPRGGGNVIVTYPFNLTPG